jgi:hypothetical protein
MKVKYGIPLPGIAVVAGRQINDQVAIIAQDLGVKVSVKTNIASQRRRPLRRYNQTSEQCDEARAH